MSYSGALSAIKTILDGISSSTLSLKFKYFETTPSSFPAGMLIPPNFSAETFEDTANNTATMVLTIRTIFPDEESQTAFEKWVAFLEALHTELRSRDNLTLGGNAYSVRITGTGHGFTNDFTIPCIFYDVQLEVKMLLST